MIGKVLLALSLISASVWELEAASACAPDCRTAAEGDAVVVPWDCTLYAVCGDLHGDGNLYPSDTVSCADGFYFNPNDPTGPSCNAIALADPGYCTPSCDPCEPLWTEVGDTTPNPDDCSQYQICLASGVFFYATCTNEVGGEYYDYFRGGCQTESIYCFSSCDHCVPYCIEEYRGTSIADPSDCTSFYTCDPPTVTQFQCPAGEYFDPTTGICGADVCVEECVAR